MLEVDALDAGHESSTVVHDVSLRVAEGDVVAIIGSNGAGKTTILRAIAGLLAPTAGTITLDGHGLGGAPPHVVARRGLAFVPAERHLFGGMSVHDNLVLGAHPDRPDPDRLQRVHDLFPRLAERHDQLAATLSGGEQQMLAVGRALMAGPRLLVLDEPTTGLAPRLAAQAYAALSRLRDAGLTVLVAEQQVPLALDLADRGYVVEDGHVVAEGAADELADDPGVRRAYLGMVGR